MAKNIKELEPNSKYAVAIQNVIKIRNWVKKNIPENIIDELDSNGAKGTFETNNYHYSWHINKTLGIRMNVGCGTLVSYKDPSRGSGCGCFPLIDDENFYYDYDAAHYGAFIDRWPTIKQTILEVYERVKARYSFEA